MSKAPDVQPSAPRQIRSVVLAAVAVVASVAVVLAVVIIGIEGPSSLGIHWPAQKAVELRADRPAPVARTIPASIPHATSPDIRSAANTVAAPVVATPAVAAPVAAPAARPQPIAPARAPKVVRPPIASTRQTASAVAPSPATKAPAPVAAPRTAPAPPKAPRAVVSAAPVGPFFEAADVDQSPKIATRVEPRMPPDLPARATSDVVVVRLLVSQTGHPSRVSLLRGSKQGRRADDAVVAAVTQWTFSPARKRGGPVSCWYNVGVPIGRAN